MEPGVPFALLGAVELLLVVAAVGLAAAGALRRSSAGALVAVGGLLLAAVEVRTSLRLGVPASDGLLLLRAAGGVVVAAGLYTGALGPRFVPIPLYGVVVPLAGAAGPAALAAAALALAGVGALAGRRDAVGAWLAGGFALWAGGAALAPHAGSGEAGPVAVLLLRSGGALAICVGLALLTRTSLLSKVVGAIIAGVVAMALAAVGVVGSVVVSSYDRQARDTVGDAAASRLAAIDDLATQAVGEAELASRVCTDAVQCQAFLSVVVPTQADDFVVLVRRGQPAIGLAGRPGLTRSEVLGIPSLAPVQQVLNGAGAQRLPALSDNIRLTGADTQVAVIGVAAVESSRPVPTAAPTAVVVYGIRVDTEYTRRDLDLRGFGLSLLAGDPLRLVASNATGNTQGRLLRIVAGRDDANALPSDGVTIGSQGANPTVALRPVQSRAGVTVAVLAMTRDPGPALRTERDALRLLLLTAGLALLMVTVVAVLLGRRTVDPVRRLTAAAHRVATGDLSTEVGLRAHDEVGTLAQTFDAMTSSLGRLTGDLRDSAGRLQTVLASMTDGLLATDGTGTVTAVNRAALTMLGVEQADVVGEPLGVVADVRDPSGRPLVALDAVLLEEPAEVHRPDGSRLPVHVALGPLTGAEGVVLVLRDTSREREVERMKTEFLSNVSHELRTPLTPIRGYAEILVGKSLAPEQVRTFAATIRDESLKLNRVVDLLVDVASIEAGRVQVLPVPMKVRDLLDVRLEAWHRRAPARASDLTRRVAAGLPIVLVDRTWVGKALDELIDNAVKYTPAGTPIALTASWSPDKTAVRVSVKDSGPGISAQDQARLFTSFEQVDGSATRKVGGLGLGLSFVRRLAQDAGFPLSMTSTPGKGSEFSLDLPVA